ncbi:MAG: galactokinase [Candidatus Taylorbacteria bacterium]|nr:galactokinase [Candidatus Taylorbacteria bacterium]
MKRRIILSRVPFRLPLGGGSTDLPSYYAEHGGFIFAVAIDLYMDILIKEPVVDDCIHMHYLQYEFESKVEHIKHTIGREALKMTKVSDKVLISLNADTPSGTGLGSSGACSVGLLKGLSLFKGKEMSNLQAAEDSFRLTQNLGLPDGKQDPYVCALGGFVVLRIDKDGTVRVEKPEIPPDVVSSFEKNTLLFYTGIRRDSEPLLTKQNTPETKELKHKIKEIGLDIYRSFLDGDLDSFGRLLDTHWRLKRGMSATMSNDGLNQMYDTAKKAGALGGKIIGAGGGGYFMFYCPTSASADSVRKALAPSALKEISFSVDRKGARTHIIDF